MIVLDHYDGNINFEVYDVIIMFELYDDMLTFELNDVVITYIFTYELYDETITFELSHGRITFESYVWTFWCNNNVKRFDDTIMSSEVLLFAILDWTSTYVGLKRNQQIYKQVISNKLLKTRDFGWIFSTNLDF